MEVEWTLDVEEAYFCIGFNTMVVFLLSNP